MIKYNYLLEKELDNYNKAILNMIMLNKEVSMSAIKELYNSFRIKRENGEFLNQI